MFGGDTSVILTEGGDDELLLSVFDELEKLDSDYQSGNIPPELDERMARFSDEAITDNAWRGFAAEYAASLLMASGVKGGAVSVAGCVYVIGNHPDGGLWRVALADPVPGRGESYATVDSPEGAVITAMGDSESDLASVSVLSEDAVLAAYISEEVLKRGRKEGEALLGKLSLSAVMLTKDDEIIRIYGQEAPDNTP